ncbi:hypothetical protein CWS35_04825 [Bradyrhizobium sp. SK17]|uniref:hypothetical protein n=1 Tax=Bradyrhizobium sp. SK17 TaxID=2057741 RepID=UPI000C313BCC|nr:hypothetical protein [Bradyrhizobium sp. SK17]AUC93701.1 hypothetical protein CWS35_04825 [Bradyrhizobium sp. SK17]
MLKPYSDYSAVTPNAHEKTIANKDLSALAQDQLEAIRQQVLDTTPPTPTSPNWAEMIREHKAEKKRRRTRNRVREHRAKPRRPTFRKLHRALKMATASAAGNRFMEKLVGREGDIALFHSVSMTLIDRIGAMSDAKLADALVCAGGFESITRNQVWKLRQIVAKLEADKGPWHRL